MRKICFVLMILILFLFTQTVFAQDYQATAQYLQSQIEILNLQSTLSALQNTGGPVSTPVPDPNIQLYNTEITQSNFPLNARPPMLSGPAPTWTTPKSSYYTEIYVGKTGQYSTISEAMKHLPGNAGEVVIKLVSDTAEPQAGVSIPIDRNVSSVRITSDSQTLRTVLPADRSIWFFCNGIPLIIDRYVEFGKMSMIMGGTITYAGHSVRVPKSTIIINGKAYWVYAGGQSDRDGYTSTVDTALVIVNGEVDRVYACGRAIYGETFVRNATVVVNGGAKEVYCSGYTEYASAKTTVGQANMMIYGWFNQYGLGLGQGQVVLQNPYGCY